MSLMKSERVRVKLDEDLSAKEMDWAVTLTVSPNSPWGQGSQGAGHPSYRFQSDVGQLPSMCQEATV
jgi:hypothetical protein